MKNQKKYRKNTAPYIISIISVSAVVITYIVHMSIVMMKTFSEKK